MRKEIDDAINQCFCCNNPVSRAIFYALSRGGKRIRPLIVLFLSDAISLGYSVIESALSIEFFHTASLIVDDLPCMDDDEIRRGNPSLHKAFGENIALLASYGLLIEAFQKIEENSRTMEEKGNMQEVHLVKKIAYETATKCAGVKGGILGQYYDLFEQRINLSQEEVKERIYLKTGVFFEGAFVFGWIFGGGNMMHLNDVRAIGRYFGYMFQIKDDFHDFVKDSQKKSRSNCVHLLGREKSMELFYLSKEECLCTLFQILPQEETKIHFLLKNFCLEA